LCGDTGFEDVPIPMKDYEDCQLNELKTGYSPTKNMNRERPNCKFEPYNEKFFKKENGIYKHRQQVLFNMYGFASK